MTELRYHVRARSESYTPTVEPSSRSRPPAAPVAKPPAEPFPFGWRLREVRTASGETDFEYVPLTREDLLNPQEGDQMGQDTLHVMIFVKLFGILSRRYPQGSQLTVFGDLIAYLAKAGSKAAAPDVWLARGVKDPGRRRGSFRQAEEGGEIVLAIEIVSPRFTEKDYSFNRDLYEKAEVEEYLAIEVLGEYLSSPFKLTGYRLDGQGCYQPIKADSQGRLRLSTVGLIVGPDAGGWGLEVLDAHSGERLLTGDEAEAARQREAAARQVAEAARQREAAARQVAEQRVAELEAELERLKASS
ncbi:MAG: Uma2 family endonuclease [bacterium]|nr:Uma2 family endonuclease [bacterium]